MAEAKKTTTKASTSKTSASKPAAKKVTATKTAASKGATTAKATSAATSKTTAKKTVASTKAVTGLKLHHLKPAAGAHKSKTRVGRGDASKGKTAGRGTKGTHARNTVYAGFEGGQMPLHMRLPKLRGFKNPFRTEYQVINLDRLEKAFPKGGKVTVEDLILNGLVRNGHLVKVLGNGEITVKLDITADKFSASAVKKIEAAGGKVTTSAKEIEKEAK